MSVSPLQNSSKPPPVPDVPTVMFTPEFSPLKASAAAEVRGPTVEEPSIVMSPERSDPAAAAVSGGGVVVAAAAGRHERSKGQCRRGDRHGDSASTCHLVVLLSVKGGSRPSAGPWAAATVTQACGARVTFP